MSHLHDLIYEQAAGGELETIESNYPEIYPDRSESKFISKKTLHTKRFQVSDAPSTPTSSFVLERKGAVRGKEKKKKTTKNTIKMTLDSAIPPTAPLLKNVSQKTRKKKGKKKKNLGTRKKRPADESENLISSNNSSLLPSHLAMYKDLQRLKSLSRPPSEIKRLAGVACNLLGMKSLTWRAFKGSTLFPKLLQLLSNHSLRFHFKFSNVARRHCLPLKCLEIKNRE